MRVSSKFLKTDTYRDCEAAREIVPQMTMGPVVSSTDKSNSKSAKNNQYFEEGCETLHASLSPSTKRTAQPMDGEWVILQISVRT